jgi:hypothetical protein
MRARAASARARGARETNPPAFTTIIDRDKKRIPLWIRKKYGVL